MPSDWLADNIHIANHLSRLPPGPLITYVANAGLANRLRAWFFASCIAQRHGRRLAHRWRRNAAFGSSWSWCFADPPAADPGADHDPGERLRVPWGRIVLPPERPAETAWLDSPPGASAAVLSRIWQYAPAEHWIRDGLPDPALTAAFRSAVLGRTSACPDAIGVHVRLGDFHEIGGVRPLQGYLDAVSRLLEEHGGRFRRIIVCSDQIETVLPSFASRFRDREVSSTESPGAAAERGDALAARRALGQLRTLSSCGACVLTPGSSYGAMAAALGGVPAELIRHA